MAIPEDLCLARRSDGALCLEPVESDVLQPFGGWELCRFHHALARDGLLSEWDEIKRPIVAARTAYELQRDDELRRDRTRSRLLKEGRSGVYYGARDGLIKIGWGADLLARVRAQDLVLLAREDARSKAKEQERHRQFGPPARKKEWFEPTTALLEHINDLRGAVGSSAITALNVAQGFQHSI